MPASLVLKRQDFLSPLSLIWAAVAFSFLLLRPHFLTYRFSMSSGYQDRLTI